MMYYLSTKKYNKNSYQHEETISRCIKDIKEEIECNTFVPFTVSAVLIMGDEEYE